CLEDAVSVGAVNGLGEIEDYSNVGQDLTFLAPVNLPAPTLPEFESELVNNHPFTGSSAAAPVVAAMMAIGRQIKPDSTVDELVELGKATGKSIDDYLIKDLRLVDFFAFSQALSTGFETTTTTPTPTPTPTETPTTTQRPVESPEKIFELLKVEKVWEAGFLGTGSVVAVFDRDGFATAHPAFEGKILEEVCFGDPSTDSYCSNGKEVEVGSGVALNHPGAAHGTLTAGV
ncbi:uncharacterized protein METZ01_LOCUS510678, partial [marine metagenome]